MNTFHVELQLFYIRTLTKQKYKIIPNLEKKELNKFIQDKKIIQQFFEDFQFLLENFFDDFKIKNKKYYKSIQTISFDIKVNSSVKELKDILFNNSLEDSLYESSEFVYLIKDAINYYKLTDLPKDINEKIEVGVLDYRKKTGIKIDLI
jgi:hypothetical protein